jgi:hypothetical protein
VLEEPPVLEAGGFDADARGSKAWRWRSLVLGAGASTSAQGGQTPFKLGRFQRGDTTFLGLVLNDTRVFDLTAANAAYQASQRHVSLECAGAATFCERRSGRV